MNHHLFTTQDAKTVKGEPLGYFTVVLYMAPDEVAGGRTMCPRSSPGCRAGCLYTAGMGVFDNVKQARVNRTLSYIANPSIFAGMLAEEAEHWDRYANKKRMKFCIRVNGTSDQPALARAVYRRADTAGQFYDYTKILGAWKYERNIHYTFSASEENGHEQAIAMEEGINVAMVFRVKKGHPLPESWRIGGKEYPVIDGDLHDLRFLDPKGVVVGLRPKGTMKKDTTGFVVAV